MSEWIPLGGDPAYAGAMLHYHLALNQELFRIVPDVPLIATGEFNGWSFQDGLYTDPVLGPARSPAAPRMPRSRAGLRLFVCDRIDFGFGSALRDHGRTSPASCTRWNSGSGSDGWVGLCAWGKPGATSCLAQVKWLNTTLSCDRVTK